MSPTLSAGGIRNTYIMKPRFTWAVKGSPKFRLILQTLKYELITLYNTVGCRGGFETQGLRNKKLGSDLGMGASRAVSFELIRRAGKQIKHFIWKYVCIYICILY